MRAHTIYTAGREKGWRGRVYFLFAIISLALLLVLVAVTAFWNELRGLESHNQVDDYQMCCMVTTGSMSS